MGRWVIACVLAAGCGAPEEAAFRGRDVRLDQAGGPDDDTGPLALGPVACASGAFRYVAWTDHRDGSAVVVRGSLDHGRAWADEVVVSGSGSASHPALACDQGRAVVAWEDTRDSDVGLGSVYVASTRDGGRTFTDPVRVTDDPEGAWDALEPAVAMRGERVHVVWADGRSGAFDVVHRGSADLGRTWGAEARLDTDPAGSAWSARPRLALGAPGEVFVAWEDTRDGGVDVRFQASRRHGLDGTWLASDVRLDVGDDPGASDAFAPDLVAGPEGVAVAWHDLRHGEAEVLVAVSADPFGAGFPGAPRLLGDGAPGADASRFPRLAWSGSRLVAAWFDDVHGATDVLVATSDDRGATWSEPAWLNEGGASSHARWPLDVRVDGEHVAVTWMDLRDSTLDDPREDVYVATSADAGATWAEPWRCDDDGAGKARSAWPQVLPDAGLGLVDVVWEEWRYGNADIYRRPFRWEGPR